ncbi:MAG: tRNA uridine-5-carboxymethylaminomethyl(34) synthesis enzyme MnmG, partial [Pseudomonadota bacterium]
RRHGVKINQDGRRRTVVDLLALPDVSLETLAGIWPEIAALDPAVGEQIEIDGLYSGYLDRQEADIRAFKKDERLKLPGDLAYYDIKGLSNEVRQKLAQAQPATLGQAGRIEGVTPAALAVVLAWVKKHRASG